MFRDREDRFEKGGGVHGVVGRRAVLAGVLKKDRHASWMARRELGKVVDLAVDGDPEGVGRVVARELRGGDRWRHGGRLGR